MNKFILLSIFLHMIALLFFSIIVDFNAINTLSMSQKKINFIKAYTYDNTSVENLQLWEIKKTLKQKLILFDTNIIKKTQANEKANDKVIKNKAATYNINKYNKKAAQSKNKIISQKIISQHKREQVKEGTKKIKRVPSDSLPQAALQTTEEPLLILLHAAISQHQHYPEAALQMERQGRVALSFILVPSGEVNGVKIIKSSGTKSLDDAALSALYAAVPFKNIQHYLKQQQLFNIDVVFELT